MLSKQFFENNLLNCKQFLSLTTMNILWLNKKNSGMVVLILLILIVSFIQAGNLQHKSQNKIYT